MTVRKDPNELLKLADLATDMRKGQYSFDKEANTRKRIE